MPPRMDFPIAGGRFSGSAVRYTHESAGRTHFNDLAVFRVNNDVLFQATMSRPTYGPIAHFRGMNKGFALGGSD